MSLDKPIIIVTRDPDCSNEYVTFDQHAVGVITVDVDYGYANLDDKEEFDEWAESLLSQATTLLKKGSVNSIEAASHLAGLVAEARVNYGHG